MLCMALNRTIPHLALLLLEQSFLAIRRGARRSMRMDTIFYAWKRQQTARLVEGL